MGNDVVEKLADEKDVVIDTEVVDVDGLKVIDVAVPIFDPKENKLIAWLPEQQLPLKRGA